MEVLLNAGPAAPTGSVPWQLSPQRRTALDRVLTTALNDALPRARSADPAPAGLASAVWATASSGKRLRPAVVLAAADEHSAMPGTKQLHAAAAVEMLHWATLVHDDVLDGSGTRHGRPSVTAREGLATAVLGGDLLIGTAMRLAASAGAAAAACLADTLVRLCVGQDQEERQRWNGRLTENDIITVCAGKTGSLLAAATQLGGLCTDDEVEPSAALADFGTAFGVSLQIVDDVLDLTSSAELLGKPVGTDFAGGTVTLPALVAMTTEPGLRDLLRPGLTDAEQERSLRLLRAPQALAYAAGRARHWADVAADHLSTAAETRPGLHRLASWPRRYVDVVLSTRSLAAYTDVVCAGASVAAGRGARVAV